MVVIGGKDFFGKPAPAGYVAGLGRGAIGFTTRSDIGPARESSSATTDAPGYSLDAAATQQDKEPGDETTAERYANDNEEGLLGTGPYDKEDEEADRIYAQVDAAMESRRKARREAREALESARSKQQAGSVQEKFSDLKRGLESVSEQEWMDIPEPGDMRRAGRKVKKQKDEGREFYSQTSDIILAGARSQGALASSIDAESGLASVVAGTETSMADFRQINKARDDLLRVKLDQATSSSDSSSGKTTVDPRNYISGLNSVVLKTSAEIGDIKKAKELLKSVTVTNPKHAPGWIAAARVEEIDGKLALARSLIAKGCEECPASEDIWLEAARLNTPQNAKIILANAIRQIPFSVKIWIQAMSLETDVKSKKKVIRKALEFLPSSVKLWKVAIEMETDAEDARILLSRAVECIPTSVELWLALARLESYDNAKIILNMARKANPNSHEIWISAARLEESAGNVDNIDMLVNRIVTTLASQGRNLSREDWIKEAEQCESAGSLVTCRAIIKACIGLDVEEEDQESTWLEDAKNSTARKSIETARAIYNVAIDAYPEEDAIWLKAAQMEKEHGDKESFDALLKRAVVACPQSEVLWLMRAKEKLIHGDLNGARAILTEAFKENPDSEDIWLAAVKLETENGEYERSRLLLKNAREKAGTERVWLKSAVLERNLQNYPEALNLLTEALKKYPTNPKFWMMKGQIETSLGQNQAARDSYAQGVKNCPKSVRLWILSASLEEKTGNLTRARALLDKARLINPKTAELWLETVRLEQRADNLNVAKSILAKALQECPQSGGLWMESIFLEARPSRKSRSVDALKKCDNDAVVVMAVGRLFWQDRNIEKARSWLNKATRMNPDIGDCWIWLYKFEQEHGVEEQVADVLSRCVAAEPHHGEKWCEIAKDPTNWRLKTADILKIASNLVL